jgi:hypothetical protein
MIEVVTAIEEELHKVTKMMNDKLKLYRSNEWILQGPITVTVAVYGNRPACYILAATLIHR